MNAISTGQEGKQAFGTQLLPDHPLFHGLSERHREILAECSMHASFSAGETVVEAGDPADCFYLVISGSIGLETPGSHTPLRVEVIGPGDILGWSWLFPPDYWHCNAIAVVPTEAIYFYGSRLRQECDRDRDFGCEMFKRMALRNQACRAKVPAAQRISMASVSRKTDCDKNPSAMFGRACLGASTLKNSRSGHEPFPYAWPRALLDSAKGALKCVSSASKSFMTGETHGSFSPETVPPVSPVDREI
jgi:CRP/FNR family transcriptional regulator, cyclic AMP receptor protein